MVPDIRSLIAACPTCDRNKTSTRPFSGLLHPLILPGCPLTSWSPMYFDMAIPPTLSLIAGPSSSPRFGVYSAQPWEPPLASFQVTTPNPMVRWSERIKRWRLCTAASPPRTLHPGAPLYHLWKMPTTPSLVLQAGLVQMLPGLPAPCTPSPRLK